MFYFHVSKNDCFRVLGARAGPAAGEFQLERLDQSIAGGSCLVEMGSFPIFFGGGVQTFQMDNAFFNW